MLGGRAVPLLRLPQAPSPRLSLQLSWDKAHRAGKSHLHWADNGDKGCLSSPGTAEGQDNLSADVGELDWSYSSTSTKTALVRSELAQPTTAPVQLHPPEPDIWGQEGGTVGFGASCCLS